MITLLIVLASIASYFAIGSAACRYTVPRGIQRSYEYNRREYPNLYRGEQGKRRVVREAGNAWLWLTLMFWFIMVPLTLLLQHKPDVEKFAPWAHEDEIKAREARLVAREVQIAELERELGIGR
jgi:hypothetical protein